MDAARSWPCRRPRSSVLASAVAGFSLAIALIVAIGAQNAFVLRQGLRREHVVPVVADLRRVRRAADRARASPAWVGAMVTGRPGRRSPRSGWLGAAFLLGYAALAARRALRPGALLRPPTGRRPRSAATLLACLAFTYLNPHVYLDTVAAARRAWPASTRTAGSSAPGAAAGQRGLVHRPRRRRAQRLAPRARPPRRLAGDRRDGRRRDGRRSRPPCCSTERAGGGVGGAGVGEPGVVGSVFGDHPGRGLPRAGMMAECGSFTARSPRTT